MKSKLIMRRQKKATILVSKQTVEEALQIGNSLAEEWFAANQNDPRIDKLQNSVDFMSSILNKTPQEMKQDGVSSIEEYFDDAKKPDVAQAMKKEIDMIAQWRREQRSAKPQTQVPAAATASKKANGAAFTSDRDEKGEPKVPEKLEVPRLAGKKEKKEAAPAAAPVVPTPAAAAPVAPVAPAPTSEALSPNQKPGMKGDILLLPSDILTKVVKALTSIDDLVNDKNGAALLADIAAELNTRPIEPEEKAEPKTPAPAAAPALPVAASFGGLATAGFDEDKTANASAGGGWVTDAEKGNVLEDGGRTPEVSEAHSKIDESPAKLDRPATVLPGKFAGDMTTSKALKEAEKLGDELKRIYLSAKPITEVNDSRPVREAVEAIFRAADMFGEATKVLSKQDQQEKSEEEAAKIKSDNKGSRGKSSSLGGLTFAAAE